jgi:hypothetical protein
MRKFISEFAVHMVGGPHALLQQDHLATGELHDLFNEKCPCHIYLICRRPRISILPADVRFTSEAFEGHATVQDGPSFHKEPFRLPAPNASGMRFKSDYPYSEFEILTPEGEIYLQGKTALLATGFGSQFDKHLAGEVIYVGQSYGVEGSRTAPERLKSHETLQRIYAEAIARTPDKEIWIQLWSFSPSLLISFDGASKQYGTTTEEDDEHMRQVFGSDITEQQRINFTEAALIRYFDPEYNILFRASFPNSAHTSYSECYDLDINSVAVELNTEESCCMLWSKAVAPRWCHYIHYALHSREERAAMFDFDFLNRAEL